MKAGILTFHRARNIGTCLQAYALQTYLESKNVDVEIIDYKPAYIEDSFGLFPANLIAEYKGVRKLLCFMKLLYKVPYNIRRESKFKSFRNKYYKLSKRQYNRFEDFQDVGNDYSHSFYGSDQIWNPNITYGLDPVFFGAFKGKRPVVASYAASIGLAEIPEEYVDDMSRMVSDMDFVGVREVTAKKVLDAVIDKEIYVNADPTLLISKGQWEKIASPVECKDKYIFVYALEINDNLIQAARELSEKEGLDIVFTDMKNRYGKRAHSRYTCDPSEFISYIKNAEYVITNSFHGTVFSIIFEKKFLTILHKTRGSRLIDLLTELNLDTRIIQSPKELEVVYEDIDYLSVKDKIKEKASLSESYIQKVLEK